MTDPLQTDWTRGHDQRVGDTGVVSGEMNLIDALIAAASHRHYVENGRVGEVSKLRAQLRASLEKVTAERDAMRAVVDASRAEHEPDSEDNWASSVCPMCQAIRALDLHLENAQ